MLSLWRRIKMSFIINIIPRTRIIGGQWPCDYNMTTTHCYHDNYTHHVEWSCDYTIYGYKSYIWYLIMHNHRITVRTISGNFKIDFCVFRLYNSNNMAHGRWQGQASCFQDNRWQFTVQFLRHFYQFFWAKDWIEAVIYILVPCKYDDNIWEQLY